jgi:hypothetical protein
MILGQVTMTTATGSHLTREILLTCCTLLFYKIVLSSINKFFNFFLWAIVMTFGPVLHSMVQLHFTQNFQNVQRVAVWK